MTTHRATRADRDDAGRWQLIGWWYAIAAFVPALLAEPGRISADTKTYLTVDPGRLLSSATSMWDPSVGAGTVPHQNIGYLFPLGPYYWLLDTVGVPEWIAQRLVWGALLFAASWGACRLGRLLGWSPTMAGVAGFAYGFTPYLLSYLARLSVILFPWAAMPWLIVLAMRAIRRPRWSTAAAFAGVLALVGSVNATSLLLAGLGPAVVVIADVATRRVTLRSAATGVGAIGVLSAAVSAWWIAGLSVQGAFGLPILRFTETYRAISGASTPAEVLRGLGYWFFYGGDRLDHWIGPSASYTNEGWLILLGFGIAMGSLLGLLVSFPRRGTVVAMLAVGMVISVGGAPIDSPTIYGSWFDDFASDSTIGGALRSTTRAMPLVVFALGAGFGALVDLGRRQLERRRLASDERSGISRRIDPRLVAGLGCGLIALQLFPWFIGTMTTDSLLRDDPVPSHIDALADHLDEAGTGRVLMIPGSDFAYPRDGGTIDPILPGVLDRSVLYRELVPQGSEATADLLNAHERRLHDGWAEPESWPVVARLLGATAVAAINDHQYERFRLARPSTLWPALREEFGEPDHVGPALSDAPQIDVVDGITYADPDAVRSFPAVASWELDDTGTEAVRLLPDDGVVVVDGSGDALVDLAGAGLLTSDVLDTSLIRYRASLDDPDELLGSNPWWVITDTNRAQGRRWSTLGSNLGPIEPAGTRLDLDPDSGDQRLDVFGDDLTTSPERQTVAEHRGDVALVRSSYTGSRIAYTPEDAPFMATDGDLATAWRTAVFDDARGLRLQLDLREPVAADQIVLVQPLNGVVDRFITRVRVTVSAADGAERTVDVDLDERSRTIEGQPIELPDGSNFDRLTVEILADNLGPLASYAGRPGVGFAEVRIPGVIDDRVVRLPVTGSGPGADERLTFVMTRERIDPATQNRFAPEPRLVRVFDLPTDREFELSAEVRLAAGASDALLVDAAGLVSAPTADRRVVGTTTTWGAASVDGDLDTSWTTPIDESAGATLTLPLDGREVAAVRLVMVDDDLHSLPERVALSDGEAAVSVELAAASTASDGGFLVADVAWPAELDPTPEMLVVVIEDLTVRTAAEYFSGLPQVLPVGVAEIEVPAVDGTSTVLATVDRTRPLDELGCRDDLLTVDGVPVPLRLQGTVGDLLDGAEVLAVTCTDEPLVLAGGERRLETQRGDGTGLELDRVVLDSAGSASAPAPASLGSITVDRASSTELTVEVPPTSADAWLILDESWNDGWVASVDGEQLDGPHLVDGYANGWILPPSDAARTIDIEWRAGSTVRVGILVSLLAGLVIVVLLVVGRVRREEPVPIDDAAPPRPVAAAAVRWARWASLAGVGLLTIGVVPTLIASGVVAAARRWPVPWLAPSVIVATVGITGGWVAVAETVRDHADSPDWPSLFSWTAPLVWIAVATVVATAADTVGSPTQPFGCEAR